MCKTAAKLRINERKTKFWSSECKEMRAFHLLSRDIIRPEVKFIWVFPSQNNGSELQAFGARMRMALAMVGAIRSVVTGVFTFSAWTPWP